MKTATHKLLALLALFIFFACSGTKKATETKTKETVKTETEVTKETETKTDVLLTDKSEKFSDSEIATIEKLTDNWEKNVTVYDTDKAIVPGTNKPPIKSVTIYTRSKTQAKNTSEKAKVKVNNNLQSNTEISLISKMDSLSILKATTKTKLEVKEIPATNTLVWILSVIVVIIAGVLVWRFKGIFIS